LHPVLFTFPNPTIAEVTPVTVPVKAGEFNDAFKSKPAIDAFKSKAVCVALETGLLASLVSSTFDNPTIVLSIPETVPVNVGD
jgi:hypothetical protein